MKTKCKSWEPYTNGRGESCGLCNSAKNTPQCFCNGKRECCDFYPNIREKGLNEKLYKMNGGMISRRDLNSSLLNAAREHNYELPVWVWTTIEQMETGRQMRNRRIKERNAGSNM